MSILREKMAGIIPELRESIGALVKDHGSKVISEVTVAQAYGGMRGVRALICDTSNVPAEKGLIVRGIPIGELKGRLPEEILWLLLTGELPNDEELADLQGDLRVHSEVPDYVWEVLGAMPADSHPMCMLSTAILVMQRDSVFAKRYSEGLKKEEYWEPTLEDALSIIAKITSVSAGIYRMRFNKGKRIPGDPNLDWAANFARMLGLPDPDGGLTKLMRLYLTLHCDHESGNVSANTAATVNSALSDLYYSFSAGLNGLAGPLHGLANQQCLNWIIEVKEKFSGVPTDDQLRDYIRDILSSGGIVPGYGHAVLRVTDPRFVAFYEFGKKHCAGDPIFEVMAKVFEVAPGVLSEIKKIKDPWPNVDGASGALVYHYGLTEFPYYTVLFGISRSLGICSQAVIARALGLPITRPKSVTTEWIRQTVGA